MVTLLAGSIVLGLSIAAPVGPINIEIIRRGLTFGFWPALCVGLGGMSSDLLLMFVMFLGAGIVLSWSWVQITLMLLGCLVLTHAGWTSFRKPVVSEWDAAEGNRRSRGASLVSYARGVLIAGTNPMNILFWVSIYGSVLSGALQKEDVLHSFLISSMVFIGIGLWNMNLAFIVHFSRSIMTFTLLKWIQRTAGLVLLYYGVKFGFEACLLIGKSGWL
ncbi:LysE family translocator [Halobacillus kuroshimensis]|uniref:LysE family translocator n=1 Tax=Halobacillus kuroshimensis TaxID=302481 RepID=A0ABS3DY10_9BACI|nr:LysE family translocator [Halobacillus kuroshimensis]MBN8236231.1 LysE family translocator [Halobacillus kuroshimensis]